MMLPIDWSSPEHATASEGATAVAVALVDVPRPVARWEHALERTAIAATRLPSVLGLATGGTISVGLVLLGAPWLAIPMAGLGLGHWLFATARAARQLTAEERALGPLARPLEPEVHPGEILAIDLRASFQEALHRHEALRRHLRAAQRLHPYGRPLLGRCGTLVQRAGRLARMVNPIERLANSPTASLPDPPRSAASLDPFAAETQRREAVARARALRTTAELGRVHARIRACLTMVNATLTAIAMALIKLEVLDLADAEFGTGSGGDGADRLASVLETLEQTIDDGVHALDLGPLEDT